MGTHGSLRTMAESVVFKDVRNPAAGQGALGVGGGILRTIKARGQAGVSTPWPILHVKVRRGWTLCAHPFSVARLHRLPLLQYWAPPITRALEGWEAGICGGFRGTCR